MPSTSSIRLVRRPVVRTESLVEFNDMLGANGICIGKDQKCRFLESLDLR